MQTNQHVVTASEGLLIARATRLRGRVWALHYEQARVFSGNLAALWRTQGVAGVGLACRELQRTLADVPGSLECFAEARSIASACPA